MRGRRISRAAVAASGAAGLGVLLYGLCDWGAIPDERPEALLRQASELHTFARACFARLRPGWPEEYADRYADAVKTGVLRAAEEPLSRAKMTELKAAIERDTHSAPKAFGRPQECMEAHLAKAQFDYAAITARPPPSDGRHREIEAQVAELGAFLASQTRDLLIREVEQRAAEGEGKVNLPADLASRARSTFEQRAAKVAQNPASHVLKMPLSPDQLDRVKQKSVDRARQSVSNLLRATPLEQAGTLPRLCESMATSVFPSWLFAALLSESPVPDYPPRVRELMRECGDAEEIRASISQELPRVQGSVLLFDQALLLSSEARGQDLPYP